MKIDVHAHFYPRGYVAQIDRIGEESQDPRYKAWMTWVAYIKSNPRMWAVEERLQDMDQAGMDMQVLSVALPNVYLHDEGLSVALAQQVNDALAEVCRRCPDRFRFFASLPLEQPEAALAELHRAVAAPGMNGLVLGDNINGKPLDSPPFLPILEEAERLGLPIFLHPMVPPGMDSLWDYELGSMLGYMLDNTVAAARLVFSGFLERHPNLKVIVPHLGGFFPYIMGRIDNTYHMSPKCRTHISQPPSGYFKKLYIDTVSFFPPALRCAIEVLGSEKLILGSDYPFVPESMPRAIQSIAALGLPQEEQERILAGNLDGILRAGNPP